MALGAGRRGLLYSTKGKKYYIKARNPIFFLISCKNLLSLNLSTIVSSKLASEVL
jgi:hypothetical protein